MEPKVDTPGFYLATRCKGGARPWYTKSFSVYVSEQKSEKFRVVFQCRVRPKAFTTHVQWPPKLSGHLTKTFCSFYFSKMKEAIGLRVLSCRRPMSLVCY